MLLPSPLMLTHWRLCSIIPVLWMAYWPIRAQQCLHCMYVALHDVRHMSSSIYFKLRMDLQLISSKATYRPVFWYHLAKHFHSSRYWVGMKWRLISYPLCPSHWSFCKWTESWSIKSLSTSTHPIPVFDIRGGTGPLLNVPHEWHPKPVSSCAMTDWFHLTNATGTPIYLHYSRLGQVVIICDDTQRMPNPFRDLTIF